MSAWEVVVSPMTDAGVMQVLDVSDEPGSHQRELLLCHPDDASVARWLSSGLPLNYDDWRELHED